MKYTPHFSFSSRIAAAASASALLAALALPTAFAAQTATQQVTLSTSVQDVLTYTLASNTAALGNLTPGTPVTGTVTAQVTSNAQAGFVLSVMKDNAATLTHTSGGDTTTTIADKTAWDPTASAGAGNAATWTGTGLGFRVNTASTTAAGYSTTFWGSSDSAANAKFAGLPAAYQTVFTNTASNAGVQRNVQLDLKLDVPTTQASGAYSGTFTTRVQTVV